MFRSVTLTNFRRHESLHIDFEQGLVAIRGANEAGKTTIQEAIGYAMFGTKALRQSLSEVVTYGKAESTLAVVLALVGGVVVSRSKRGAEITREGKVLCTGQVECTRWFEKLLNCNADMATKLMMAKQSALQGALTGGPTEAAQMIETLADFDLIERVVALIQNKLPTGATTVLEESLARQQERFDSLVPPDTASLDSLDLQEKLLNETYGKRYQEQKDKAAELAALDVAAARRFMVELAAAKRDLAALDEPIAAAHTAATTPVQMPSAGVGQIAAWRQQLMGLKDATAQRTAYVALQAIAEPEVTWEGSAQGFREALRNSQIEREALSAAHGAAVSRAAAAAAQRITETSCAFCGKDLTDVPEVTRRNVEADAAYQKAQAEVVALAQRVVQQRAEWQELHTVDQKAHEYESAINRYAAFIIFIDDRYPKRWQWRGEAPLPADDQTDYNAMIKAAEAAQAAYSRAVGAQDASAAHLRVLKAQHLALASKIEQTGAQEVAIGERIRAAEVLEREVHTLGIDIQRIAVDLETARGQLALVRQRIADAERQRVDLAAAVVTGQQQLDAQRFNNALLKRVRAARPFIADKLWTIVLASVSHQFSQIRGVSSVITRTDNGFKCDGQEVAGLSGSTLDALGLAIRIALTKTFLPNSRFMMLDEPGSACDNEREGNMLGLIAASDFDQTLLVTHSALADSFAAQVVSL